MKKHLFPWCINKVSLMPFILFSFLFLGSIEPVKAQYSGGVSNHKVSILLTHPPLLGIKVHKVAFGPATGKCADQIVNALVSDFVSNNIEVLDRADLNTVLSEHDFSLSGYVDRTTAAALGKIIGPSVLIFVKVQRCAAEQKHLYKTELKYNYQAKRMYKVLAYYSTTTVYLKASIQAVDLTTGKIFAAQTVNYQPSKSNKSYQGYPEFPSKFDVQDEAINSMVIFAHDMFLPWTETRSFYFYSDKKCGLRQAYQALKAGNKKDAYNISQKNLEACKNEPKVKNRILAHAFYNMGVSYMFSNDYDNALKALEESKKLKSDNAVNEVFNYCYEAKVESAKMRQVEQNAKFQAAQQKAETEKARQAEFNNTLTNADVIKLSQEKIPDALIIEKINTSKCNFDTSTDAIVKLTNAHVSNNVIIEMMKKK